MRIEIVPPHPGNGFKPSGAMQTLMGVTIQKTQAGSLLQPLRMLADGGLAFTYQTGVPGERFGVAHRNV